MTQVCWIELSRGALTHNLKLFRELLPNGVMLGAVVKANAYGHGFLEVAQILQGLGVDFFCVNSLDEALLLKRWGASPRILIMGYVPLSDLEPVVTEGLRIVVYNQHTVKRLGEIAQREERPVYLHLKLETGTHRQGVSELEIPEFIELIKRYPNLVLEGAYTHFANIEDTTDHRYAGYQLECFRRAISVIESQGLKVPIKHTACSAATLLFPESYFDLVRLGIGLYGFWPSRETYISYRLKNNPDDEHLLRPVLSWKTRIAQLKTVPKNSFIGYGCTYRVTHDSTIAVLPVGYYDGYDRGLSNLGYVLIHGERAPIRGRVCMNLTMVDVTHIPGVKPEDEVILIGEAQGEAITADQLAAWLGTIHYEVVTRLNPSLPRIIVE